MSQAEFRFFGVFTSRTFTFITLTLSSFLLYWSLLESEAGQEQVAWTAGRFRGWLQQQVPERNGFLFQAANSALDVFVDLPLLVSLGGSRLVMFELHQKMFGNVYPFAHGAALTSYADVHETLTSSRQPRGIFLGARPVPAECLHPELLIFLPTGEKHSHVRDFLHRAVPAFGFKKDTFNVPITAPRNANASSVKRVLVGHVWERFWQMKPSEEELDVLVEYLTYGGLCVLGPLAHKLSLGYASQKIMDIRARAVQAAKKSPVGERMLAMAKEEDMPEVVLTWAVDGVLFAGLFGTTHLATSTLARIQRSPARMVPLWKKDRVSFLLESSRLDPPVTSVTSLFAEDTVLNIRGVGEVKYPSGTTRQLMLATANRDPLVFGGISKSVARARQFDPSREHLDRILSWNGPHGNLSTSPRGCLGYGLSVSVAEQVVDHFLPEGKTSTEKMDLDHVFTDDDGGAAALDRIGHLVWMIGCVITVVWIRLAGARYGPVSGPFATYLSSQAVASVGLISHLPLVFTLARCVSAAAGLGVSLRWHIHRAKGDLPLMRGGPFVVLTASVLLLSWLLPPTDALHASHRFVLLGHASASFGVIQAVYLAWARSDGRDGRMRAGLLGMIMTTGGFVAAAFILGGTQYVLISRCFATLALPLLAQGFIAMSEEVEADLHGKPEDVHAAARVHRSATWVVRTLFCAIIVIVIAGACQQGLEVLRAYELCSDEEGVKMAGATQELCMRSYLKEVDGHTATMLGILKGRLKEERTMTCPEASSIRVPAPKRDLTKKEVLPGVSIPVEDEDFPPADSIGGSLSELVSHAFDELLRSRFFPLYDTNTRWRTFQEGRMGAVAAIGPDTPPRVCNWTEITSDDSISRLCLAGLAAHTLVRLENESLVSDFTWMAGLATREGFERYGAAAHLSPAGNLVAIEWPVGQLQHPWSPHWEHAKWVFKASVLTGVTLKDHLVGTHLVAANLFTMAAAEQLDAAHPLRRLMKPHTFGTVTINRAASTYLLAERGLLHRAVGLSWEGIVDGFQYALHTSQHVGVTAFLKAHNTDTLSEDLYPWGRDLMEFQGIVARYVRGYADVYWATEDDILADQQLLRFWDALHVIPDVDVPELSSREVFVEVIANFICQVTGLHNHVGNVAEYLADPREGLASKIRPDTEVADVQATMQAANIALMTAFKEPPLLGDYTHLLLRDRHFETTSKLMRVFQEELVELSKDIDVRNPTRRFPTNAFNPKIITSSVSI